MVLGEINNMDYNDKIETLLKFWSRTGSPSIKDSLFFGWKFENMTQYLDVLGKYYGINDMKQHMINEYNEILQKYDKCESNLALEQWNIEDYPMSIPYNGWGGKPTQHVYYDYDENWEFPTEWFEQSVEILIDDSETYSSDVEKTLEHIESEVKNYIYDAYDDVCVHEAINKAHRYIWKKYGMSSNMITGLRDYTILDKIAEREAEDAKKEYLDKYHSEKL